MGGNKNIKIYYTQKEFDGGPGWFCLFGRIAYCNEDGARAKITVGQNNGPGGSHKP
jgi:hypothetical protein